MKISIALSILILAAAAALGWHDHQRLVTVREHPTQLVAEAATLGLALDPSRRADPVRITKRERENKEVDAKAAAAEFIAFAKEMEAIERRGGPPDEATQKRIMEFMDRMMSLDSAQLKILIAEIRADKSLKDESRQDLISFSIMTLANDHPQTALALFTESSDLFKDSNMMSEHVISSSLAKWAKDDPLTALEWVRKNGEKLPDLVTDDAKCGMISGAATNDPKSAFKLIGEFKIKDHGCCAALPACRRVVAVHTRASELSASWIFRLRRRRLDRRPRRAGTFTSGKYPLSRRHRAPALWLEKPGNHPPIRR